MPEPRRPLLSAAVISYNTAPWLPACLDSMLAQGVDGTEIVVVDDGSTDESVEIVQEYAAAHPSVVLVQQENGGVSAARRTGIDRSRGRYLTLVDSDDRVSPGAWARMVATLEQTGSDLVVGAAERVDGERRFMTPLMRRNHRVERLGITLEDQPLMLADVFAWNKVFRRSSWDKVGVEFALGMSYQDQPALTQVLLAAERFDVLTDVVYEWTVRGDQTSATQQRRTLPNLRQRVVTKQMTIDRVQRDGSARLLPVLYGEVLPIDMWEHFRAVPGCDDEYWTMLRDAVRDIWGPHTMPFEQTAVPVQQRLMGCLVAQDRRTDLLELLDHLDRAGPGERVVDGVLQHPWLDDPRLPVAASHL